MAKTQALGYVRVSTTEQTKGSGLSVQRKAVRDYCNAHELALVDILADEGISGSNGLETRQGLATALALIERGDASVLVVYRLDRLARDLMLQETTIQRLRAAHAAVVSVSEPDVDSEEPTRRLVRQVLGAIAEYEKAVIRGRMMAGKAAKVARGGYGGGQTPYGYAAKDKGLVKHDAEQVQLARMVELRKQGLSLRQLADQLEVEGLRPRRGSKWQPASLARVLKKAAADG